MTDGPLRVALLGYGFGGRVFHAPLIAAVDGLELACVVTSDAGRAVAAQAAHPGCEVLPDAAALWERAGELDVAVVSTPNRTHAPLARAALEHGIATVVDKPLTPTGAEGRELVALAEQLGVPLTVFHNRRWDSDFRTARALVDDGRLGTVHRFESRFERWRPAASPSWKEDLDPAAGGGAVFDLGAHLVDQSLQLLGPVADVYAEIDVRRPGAVAADDAFIAIRHASGAVSHLWMSYLAASPGPRLRVLGDRGAYTVWGMDPQEERLIAGDLADASLGRSTPGRRATFHSGDESGGAPTAGVELLPGDYLEFYARLARALRGDGPLPCDPRDGVRVVELLELAVASAADRAVIAVPAEH